MNVYIILWGDGMREKKQQLVVKDNALINAAYTLGLAEQRLILMSIVGARKDGHGITSDKALSVRAEDYAEQFKVTRQAAYMALSSAVTALFGRYFTYNKLSDEGNPEPVKSRWVSRVSYVEAEGRIHLTFGPDVVPFITRLEKHFTSYDLAQVSGLTSTYAVRLYEQLIAWRSTCNTPEIKLEDLRRRLGVEESEYKDMRNFKARVLDLAIKQINQHTDITASYEQHKSGRTITGFSFTFTLKQPDRDPNTIDMLSGITDAERARPKRQKISKQQAEAMAVPGESWEELIQRLKGEYFIDGLAA